MDKAHRRHIMRTLITERTRVLHPIRTPVKPHLDPRRRIFPEPGKSNA